MEKMIQILLLLTLLDRNKTIRLMELFWTCTGVMQVAFGFKRILLISLEVV